MPVTLHPHICEVCRNQFSSRKRVQRTCGLTCRATLAGNADTKMICRCGKPARSRRGYCAECALEQKRASRRNFYAKHREKIGEQRRVEYAESAEVRAAYSAASARSRFNGLRLARLRKDRFTCQHCGSREQLVVHHQKKAASKNRKDEVSDITNLLTLCRSCHMNHHRKMGDLNGKAARTSEDQQSRQTVSSP